MIESQYVKLAKKLEEENITLYASELRSKKNRTLIFSQQREYPYYTHHVYLKDGLIYMYKYYEGHSRNSGMNKIASSGYPALNIKVQDLAPTTPVQAEKSDYEFCKLLISKGVKFKIRPPRPNIEVKDYYGVLAPE